MNLDSREKLLIQNIPKVFAIKAYVIGTFQIDRAPAVFLFVCLFVCLFNSLVCKHYWTYTKKFIKKKKYFKEDITSTYAIFEKMKSQSLWKEQGVSCILTLGIKGVALVATSLCTLGRSCGKSHRGESKVFSTLLGSPASYL